MGALFDETNNNSNQPNSDSSSGSTDSQEAQTNGANNQSFSNSANGTSDSGQTQTDSGNQNTQPSKDAIKEVIVEAVKEYMGSEDFKTNQHTLMKESVKDSLGQTLTMPAQSGDGLTLEAIKQMSSDQINANWAEVSKVLSNQR